MGSELQIRVSEMQIQKKIVFCLSVNPFILSSIICLVIDYTNKDNTPYCKSQVKNYQDYFNTVNIERNRENSF